MTDHYRDQTNIYQHRVNLGIDPETGEPLEPPRKEDIFSFEDDELQDSALDRDALVDLEITSDRGEECQDMMLLLNFLGFSKQEIQVAVKSFWEIALVIA